MTAKLDPKTMHDAFEAATKHVERTQEPEHFSLPKETMQKGLNAAAKHIKGTKRSADLDAEKQFPKDKGLERS